MAALLGLAPHTASAQTTLTFDALGALDPSPGVNYVDNCYVESGFRVMAVGDPCGMAASLATYTSADPTGYTGSAALFSTYQASVDFMPVAGGPFSLNSIDLAPFLLGTFDVNPVTVMFTGMRTVGGTATQSVMLPAGLTGLTHVDLMGFTGLSSARLTVTSPDFEPYVQFDNVAVTATPEPATLALTGLGLAALGLAARRRRSTR